MARELGSKVYNRYITQRKLRSRQLEKVQEVYEGYIHLLAKDSQVGAPGRGSSWGLQVTEQGARQFVHLLTSTRSRVCESAAAEATRTSKAPPSAWQAPCPMAAGGLILAWQWAFLSLKVLNQQN